MTELDFDNLPLGLAKAGNNNTFGKIIKSELTNPLNPHL